MYIPTSMQMQDVAQSYEFIRQFGFGILISQDFNITHIPFLVDTQQHRLYAHMAKANHHWKQLNQQQVSVIFNGPHSYISPRWYTQYPAVPTWNYAAVQVTGQLLLLDETATVKIVTQLMQQYEPELLQPPYSMPDNIIERLKSAIVGISIDITSIEGKLKLGQHKSTEDQKGVLRGLECSSDINAQALAQYMKSINTGIG